MNEPTIRKKVIVQVMLGLSLVLGVISPLLMYIITNKRKMNIFYRETSRKALNFHLTIFPFFLIRYFLPQDYGNFIYIVLAVELIFILNAMFRIGLNKPYTYPIAIPYIRGKIETREKKTKNF
ncbi:hypothetical protein ABD68_11185 [Bacillus endophyticus]|jgi:hypothetical protein|uniref:DUF4870 domain-containing protein n=1 Tax=Priestia endophytica TaxID=135735 RepID=UPI0018CD0B1E|nr:DUF4870 domain-containing protein [Priestia endophytica]MBG9812154.1 hypothetical protein [Priestia endophytica]